MDPGRPADAHLKPEELEWLLSAAEGSPIAPDSADAPPAGAIESARLHLGSCAACRGTLEQHHKVAASLASLKAMRLIDAKPDLPRPWSY